MGGVLLRLTFSTGSQARPGQGSRPATGDSRRGVGFMIVDRAAALTSGALQQIGGLASSVARLSNRLSAVESLSAQVRVQVAQVTRATSEHQPSALPFGGSTC